MKKLGKRHYFLLATLLLATGGGYSAYSWWHSQASTTVVKYGTAPSGDVLGSATRLVDWKTAYFTTKVSSTLRQRSSTETPDKPIIGSYMLSSTSARATDQLAVTIGTSNGSIDGLSAVRFRQLESAEYTPATRNFVPAGALVFSRTSSYETSVFWQHGTEYAAVVVSGSSARQAELEAALEAVVSNWQWN